MVASIKRRSGGVARGLISPPRPIRRQSLPAKSSSILNLGEPSSSEEEKMQIWQKWQHLNLSLWCDEKYQCHIRLFIWLSISIYTNNAAEWYCSTAWKEIFLWKHPSQLFTTVVTDNTGPPCDPSRPEVKNTPNPPFLITFPYICFFNVILLLIPSICSVGDSDISFFDQWSFWFWSYFECLHKVLNDCGGETSRGTALRFLM